MRVIKGHNNVVLVSIATCLCFQVQLLQSLGIQAVPCPTVMCDVCQDVSLDAAVVYLGSNCSRCCSDVPQAKTDKIWLQSAQVVGSVNQYHLLCTIKA